MIIRGLDDLQEVEAVFQGKRFLRRSQLTGDAHKALMAAGVAVPPTLKEVKYTDTDENENVVPRRFAVVVSHCQSARCNFKLSKIGQSSQTVSS